MRTKAATAAERRMIMVKCKYEGTGIWDGRCTGTKEVDPCQGYDKCKQYKPNYTTNADRIRAMSDENLAWELMLWRCEAIAKYHGIESQYPDTHSKILDWLQKPTE